MKKTVTSLALAGVLVLGGASAAGAVQYPVDEPEVTASDTTPVAGQPVTLTVRVPEGITEVTFTVNGAPAGSTLTSMVFASASTVDLSVNKPVVNGTASAVFTPAGNGTFTAVVTAPGMEPISIDVVVGAATTPGDDSDGLATTGGDVPAGVIWAGVGAIGLGGIAVATAAARRRSSSNNS